MSNNSKPEHIQNLLMDYGTPKEKDDNSSEEKKEVLEKQRDDLALMLGSDYTNHGLGGVSTMTLGEGY